MSPPQEVAGRYRLDRRLGAGGMSTVFLGVDTVLERPVAVKLLAEHLADDEVFVQRFRHEALAAARLQHPNIVQVFDSGMDADSHRHFIVMEYVDGPSCADLLREANTLDVDETVRIIRDSCHGLDYAHRSGVIHRDVKPGNLLVASDTGAVKLADFGIAKAAEQTRITQVGSVLGTAAYLSPEQAQGQEAGPASDIYSLGVCAYQFLTGRLPHEYGSLTELALKQQQDEVVPIRTFNRDVPEALDAAIRLCLSRDPAGRYENALELAEAVDAGLHGHPTEVTQRLQSLDTADATQALPATTAMPRTRAGRAPAPALPDQTSAYRPAPRQRAAPARRPAERKRGRRLANFVAGLAILAAGAVVAIAILQSTGESGPQPVNEGDVRGQVQGLQDLIRENQR